MEVISPSVNLPIVVQPMIQRSEVRDKNEDWTGKNSTALRRKLQNRLNKRASRKSSSPISSSRGTDLLPGRRKTEALQATAPIAQDPDPILQPAEQEFQRVACIPLPTQIHFEIAKRPYGHLPNICIQSSFRNRLTAAQSFAQFLEFPLPVDQKLLTLLHFNLVRAMTVLVLMLKQDPDRMNDDLESPFILLDSGLEVEKLPVTMKPTSIQRSISHHPEGDMFPFPEWRDNFILAGEDIDDVELCMDILYGVDPVESDRGVGSVVGRTGMIVWDEPWLQSSWEIEEGFARKWSRLVRNCTSLIQSTNYWRASRGERPLLLEV